MTILDTLMKRYFLILVSLMLQSQLFGAIVTWDGGAGTSDWSDAINWSGNVLPGPNDNAIIGTGDSVSLANQVTIRSLQLDNAKLTIVNNGKLSIVGSLGFGLNSDSSEIQNNGIVMISAAADRALFLTGNTLLENHDSIYILADDVASGWLSNQSSFRNYGSFELDSTGNGIHCYGLVENYGQFMVSVAFRVGTSGPGVLIRNTGNLKNFAGATIKIRDKQSGPTALSNEGQVNNWGKIYSTGMIIHTISNKGTFINHDTLELYHVTGTPITNTGISSFTNEVDGMIIATSQGGPGSRLINNNSIFINKGSIHLENFDAAYAFYQDDINGDPCEFFNHGLLYINNGEGSAINSGDAATILQNYSTGAIKINNMRGNSAFGIFNVGQTVNDGMIEIDSCRVGIFGANSSTTFDNSDSICISNTKRGIQLLGHQIFTNKPDAFIQCKESEEVGLLIQNGATLINQESAEMHFLNEIGVPIFDVNLGGVLDNCGILSVEKKP